MDLAAWTARYHWWITLMCDGELTQIYREPLGPVATMGFNASEMITEMKKLFPHQAFQAMIYAEEAPEVEIYYDGIDFYHDEIKCNATDVAQIVGIESRKV